MPRGGKAWSSATGLLMAQRNRASLVVCKKEWSAARSESCGKYGRLKQHSNVLDGWVYEYLKGSVRCRQPENAKSINGAACQTQKLARSCVASHSIHFFTGVNAAVLQTSRLICNILLQLDSVLILNEMIAGSN